MVQEVEIPRRLFQLIRQSFGGGRRLDLHDSAYELRPDGVLLMAPELPVPDDETGAMLRPPRRGEARVSTRGRLFLEQVRRDLGRFYGALSARTPPEQAAAFDDEWCRAVDELEVTLFRGDRFIGPIAERPGLAQAQSAKLFAPPVVPVSATLDGPRTEPYSPGEVMEFGRPCSLRHFTTGEMVIVHAGDLDDTAKEAYKKGQCHAMALALHEATGWKVHGVFRPVGMWVQLVHVVVEAPDGTLFDASGRRSEQELCVRGCHVRELNSDELTELASGRLSESRLQRPWIELARAFVPETLRNARYPSAAAEVEARLFSQIDTALSADAEICA